MTKSNQQSNKNVETKVKAEQDHKLTKELDMSFPASDPPASVQPGSGVTGPEVRKK